MEVLTGGDGEESGVSDVEEEKELEDNERKDVLDEGVAVDGEGGRY